MHIINALQDIMLNALRISVRTQTTPPLFSSFTLANKVITRKSTGLRFVQSVSDSNQRNSSDKMDKQSKPEPESKSGDTMSSFGEGYATRSDEEGFGGVYGGNQYLAKDEDHKNAPAFDHSQGSEVKEKEKARNQEKVAS